jgi:hypothetical protein
MTTAGPICRSNRRSLAPTLDCDHMCNGRGMPRLASSGAAAVCGSARRRSPNRARPRHCRIWFNCDQNAQRWVIRVFDSSRFIYSLLERSLTVRIFCVMASKGRCTSELLRGLFATRRPLRRVGRKGGRSGNPNYLGPNEAAVATPGQEAPRASCRIANVITFNARPRSNLATRPIGSA